MDLNQLQLFVRVVQAGSFTAAARTTGVPKSTLSRKVSALEDQLRARLLHRTTRRLALTDAGRLYFDHASRVLIEAQAAEQAVAQMESAPRGLLRVTAPMSFRMLAPLVAAYLRAFPQTQVDLVCTDRRVDLVEEGFDVAVRAGHLADSSLVASPLGPLSSVLVAAPSYCRKHGVPRAPPELQRHACLVFGVGQSPAVWRLQSEAERVEVRVERRLVVNDPEVLVLVALEGLGIAWLPAFACADHVRAGRLRHLLPGWGSTPIPLQALVPTARHLSPKVSEFIKLLKSRMRLRV